MEHKVGGAEQYYIYCSCGNRFTTDTCETVNGFTEPNYHDLQTHIRTQNNSKLNSKKRDEYDN